MDQGSTQGFRRISDVQVDMSSALTIAAEGSKPDNAKPFKGVDGGVFEIALKHRGDAFRVLYAVKIGADIWVDIGLLKDPLGGLESDTINVNERGFDALVAGPGAARSGIPMLAVKNSSVPTAIHNALVTTFACKQKVAVNSAAYLSAQYRAAIPLVLLIVVILFRPQGLLGRIEERTV